MAKKKIAVVAIGGNSLIADKDRRSVQDQYLAAKQTCHHIADMVEAGWNVVVTHGNGPQVGFILRRSEIAHRTEGMHEIPLDVCGADSQGALGYALQQNLQNEFFRRGVKKPCVSLVTQTLVDAKDPAFLNPDKPIGSFMTESEARRRAEVSDWRIFEDAGRGFRRVVPSPMPKEIVELDSIRALIEKEIVVIACGGGGIPVVDKGGGEYVGTAAVVDKDFASSLLAQNIGADLFVISTAVEKVALNFGKPDQKWVDRMTLAEAKQHLAEGAHFAKGSMGPKIQAIVWYLENGGSEALITNPENLGRALAGETGTRILP